MATYWNNREYTHNSCRYNNYLVRKNSSCQQFMWREFPHQCHSNGHHCHSNGQSETRNGITLYKICRDSGFWFRYNVTMYCRRKYSESNLYIFLQVFHENCAKVGRPKMWEWDYFSLTSRLLWRLTADPIDVRACVGGHYGKGRPWKLFFLRSSGWFLGWHSFY